MLNFIFIEFIFPFFLFHLVSFIVHTFKTVVHLTPSRDHRSTYLSLLRATALRSASLIPSSGPTIFRFIKMSNAK